MKVVTKTDEYTIYLKRNNRHGVQGADRQWINGEEKVRILLENDLIKVAPKAPEPAPDPVAAEAETPSEDEPAAPTEDAGE